ncbi:SUKH-4 family immunity protein [Streptomyces sp. ISL-96]|uniref:SUKH-4 family immunity protein n=1 Tax=Streptomyces sp. ISL-96 TaxID=2819191 RepID=UPI001BEC196C|nr:SUKH-4 family immunity protein [Streptomyces sp. ISL-96]MBT2487479.1 SUKH-4 family immunity protein [Streptomyces sp. ISL-96]
MSSSITASLREWGRPPVINHRYSIEYVACVRNLAMREYLSSVGLPVGHVLFSASEATGGGAKNIEGRDLLKLGSGGDGADAYCIDCESGQVFNVDNDGLSLFLVNSSPQNFSKCLNVFELEIGQTVGEADPAVLEGLSDLLGRSLAEIDSSALEDDPGFWRSILFDVAIGDYVDDEEWSHRACDVAPVRR